MNRPWGEFEREGRSSLEALIRHMISVSGKSGAQISRDMGRSDNFVWSTLQNMQKGSKLRVNLFVGIAEHCGYDIEIRGHGEEYALRTLDGDLEVLSPAAPLLRAITQNMSGAQAAKAMEIVDEFCDGFATDKLARAKPAGIVSNSGQEPGQEFHLFYDVDGDIVARCFYDKETGEPTTMFYK